MADAGFVSFARMPSAPVLKPMIQGLEGMARGSSKCCRISSMNRAIWGLLGSMQARVVHEH